ncbi:hypothetical protein PUATCC27989T_00463 [Phytobacter ursingii]|nr:hypothetical protein PUATCC27989T_00463 [Phytobacter ursingii]
MEESRKQFLETFEEITGWEAQDYPNQDAANLYWQFWQASRQAIEIELQKPKQGTLPGDYHIGYDSGAESQYESDVEVIRAAGLRIKGE